MIWTILGFLLVISFIGGFAKREQIENKIGDQALSIFLMGLVIMCIVIVWVVTKMI